MRILREFTQDTTSEPFSTFKYIFFAISNDKTNGSEANQFLPSIFFSGGEISSHRISFRFYICRFSSSCNTRTLFVFLSWPGFESGQQIATKLNQYTNKFPTISTFLWLSNSNLWLQWNKIIFRMQIDTLFTHIHLSNAKTQTRPSDMTFTDDTKLIAGIHITTLELDSSFFFFLIVHPVFFSLDHSLPPQLAYLSFLCTF